MFFLAAALRHLFLHAARNFKLLDELEEAQKGKTGSADISLGLVRDDDTYMHDWQATIFQAAVRTPPFLAC